MLKQIISTYRLSILISLSFLSIGLLLGISLHDWLLNEVIGRSASTQPVSSIEFCEMTHLASVVCSTSNIDPILQQKIKGAFQTGTEQTLFPMNVRVEVNDDFEQDASFPKEQYKLSSTVYSATVSPEELRILIGMKGIKNISEFEPIDAN